MGALDDHLEIITRMFGPGRATYDGTYAQRPRRDQPAQGHPGAASRSSSAATGASDRSASRSASPTSSTSSTSTPAEVAARMADLRQRCEDEGRDPATLRFRSTPVTRTSGRRASRRVDFLGGSTRSGSTGSSASPAAGTVARGAGAVRRGLPGRPARDGRARRSAPAEDQARPAERSRAGGRHRVTDRSGQGSSSRARITFSARSTQSESSFAQLNETMYVNRSPTRMYWTPRNASSPPAAVGAVT